MEENKGDQSQKEPLVAESNQFMTAVYTCRHCKQEIPVEASKCFHCSSFQNRWLSWLTYAPSIVSIGMMCIAIAQIYIAFYQTDLSYQQFNETKKQRTIASDALNSAEYAKSTAQSISDEMKRLSLEMKELYADSKERVDSIAEITGRANAAVAGLQSAIDFSLTIEDARNDSKKSLDALLAIENSKDSNYSKLASRALYQILASTHVENLFMTDPQWHKYNVDPEKESLSVLTTIYKIEHPYNQVRMQYSIWKQERFPKYDRINFLVEVINSTSSVRCLQKACELLEQEAKTGKNFLAYNEFLLWWDTQKNCFKESDGPCQ